MKFAHSLGYPHCDLMLAEMTAPQLIELYVFFEIEANEHEQHKIERENSNIEKFFDIAEANQENEAPT
jgi:hypothetical protein